MAKSKNHTSHHQNRKDHRNGIKRPKKIPIRSFEGQERKFVFNLRKSRKNNKTPKENRELQKNFVDKRRILFQLVKAEGVHLKHARELGQSLLRKRMHSRPNAKIFVRKLSGDHVRASLTKRFRRAQLKAAAKKAPAQTAATKTAPVAKAPAAKAQVKATGKK